LLHLLRAVAISKFAVAYPKRDVIAAANAAVEVSLPEIAGHAVRAVAASSEETAFGHLLSALTSGGADWRDIYSDVVLLHGGALTPERLVMAKLWPTGKKSSPPIWADLASDLHRLGREARVWTEWYDHVVKGSPRSDAWEAVFTDMPGPLPWHAGPEAVNAEIATRLGGLSVKEGRREDTLEILDVEPLVTRPPDAPLPPPSPATRFAYIDGQFDVVPPTTWQEAGSQAAIYHARARQLAVTLADRLTRTDAVPDLVASVGALIDILGDGIHQVQPDQLRLASRSISARARVYGHPEAQWEISAESVSAFFELADVLIDLQAFVRNELEAHENAIRQLDLTPETAAEAKTALDLVTEGILASPELISERVELAFESAAKVSDTAVDGQVKISVEGDRTLQVGNLALAVVRELAKEGETPVQIGCGQPPGRLPPEEPSFEPGKPEKRKRQPRHRGAARARAGDGEFSFEGFCRRIVARVNEKGPDKIGDAMIEAATSVIKHTPKSVPGFGALLALALADHPLFVAGGAFATTAAWIGYELRRRNRPKK
jgi:hypothetical protein